MSKRKACVFAVTLMLLASGCGAASGDTGSGKLEPSDVRPALRTLPYRFKLRRVEGPPGNIASFRGRAHGRYHTTLEFSIAIGDPPMPVPVPGAGTAHVVWEEAFGYVYNDNGLPNRFKTSAQWHAAAMIGVEIEERLCKAASGEPCPI